MSQYSSPVSPNGPVSTDLPQPTNVVAAQPSIKPPTKSSRIGPYILTKTLGMGSTGRVKLGIHQKTNQKVAIKIIPKQAITNGQSQNLALKIEREIVIMRLIQHPSVMQLYDVYETDEELYLILEHVEGGELFDYLVKRGRLDEKEACSFFQQIIFGLDYCHKHQICHRDLKPENLLLDSQRRIKIADFGMASLQQAGKMLETSCGSPHYASPEIIRGVKYDGALSDIWSCGVILYALLSGNLPFDDENIRRLLSKVKTGKYYMPPHISPSAQDLITRMLNVDPDQRIRMIDVMNHPWFMTIPISSTAMIPISRTITDHTPVPELEIDPSLVKSLELLGWTDELHIRSALTSPHPAPEKVYYHLLRARKETYLQNYMDDEDDNNDMVMDNEGEDNNNIPRRRAESLASVFAERTIAARGKSDSSLLSGGSASSRSNNNSNCVSSSNVKLTKANSNTITTPTTIQDQKRVLPPPIGIRSLEPLPQTRQHIITRSGEISTKAGEGGDPSSAFRGRAHTSAESAGTSTGNKTKPSSPSPLSPNSSHTILSSSLRNQLSSSGSTAVSYIPSPLSTTPNSSLPISGQQKSKSGVIVGENPNSNNNVPNTPLIDTTQINTNRSQQQQQPPPCPHTPLSATNSTNTKSALLGVSQTELNASSPTLAIPHKKSWFAQIMASFKPHLLTVHHKGNVTITLSLLKRLLPELGIKVQEGRRGGLKCKAEVAIPLTADGIVHDNNNTSTSMASSNSSLSPNSNGPSSSTMGTGLRIVKFRIDVSETTLPTTNDTIGLSSSSSPICVLSFALQQGPMAAMQHVIGMLEGAGIGGIYPTINILPNNSSNNYTSSPYRSPVAVRTPAV